MLKIFYKIIYILFIISLIILGIEIFNLGIIPNKYLLPIIITTLLLIIIITLGFILSKKKVIKIVISIIEIICIIISIVTIIYMHNTNNFFNKIKNDKSETNIYYLIVEKNSKYTKTKELNNKTIGVFEENKKATKKLKEEINYKQEKINQIKEIIKKANNIDSIFINSAYYDLLCEENKTFEKNNKIIGKIQINNKNTLKNKSVDITKEPYSILISGIDTDGPISTTSRSDVNIIMTINPNTHKILLNHIPRDYYVQLHGTTGLKDKLTHSGVYGINMTVQTIEDLLNIDINYYIRVNFTSLVNVVDAIGGIDVESDRAFSEKGYSFKKGINHLNGKEALMYSRIRHVLPGGDRYRGVHQEDVITAILNKVTTSTTILNNYNELLKTLSNSFQTNLSSKDIKKFIKKQLENPKKWEIETYNLDGQSTMGPTYTKVNEQNHIHIMVPYQNTIDKAKQKIKEYLNS